jgi:DNA gyrase/topoisomerase IV subunit B
VCQTGKKLECSIREGEPKIGGKLEISEPQVTSYRGSHTGTMISFKPSKHVFRHLTLPDRFLKTRMFEIAVCNPHYKIYYNGELLKIKSRIESSLFPNRKTIRIEVVNSPMKFKSIFFLVPKFVESGDHYHTLVNNIFAHNGGIHIDTFKRVFPGSLLRALERESKRRKLVPNRSDISEGLLVYNITTMQQPDFDSQSKSRLINEDAGDIIRRFFENDDFIKSFIKENAEWIDEIYQRCADRTQRRDASELSKLSKKVLRNKVPGLMDATASRRNDCILFLAEGDSAIGGMASVRNPEIHGGLALRGKIMNVNGENPKKVLDNKCLTEIMNSIGLVIGQEAKRHNLRYGKVYLATDMDHDGFNIAALLINFFYTYWPELFNPEQPPFVYVFQTPFVIAEKGRHRKYWYAHDYNGFDPKDYVGWSITRAKGLGTLSELDWEHSMHNPILMPIVEDGNLHDSLDLIFSPKKADARKQWIGL